MIKSVFKLFENRQLRLSAWPPDVARFSIALILTYFILTLSAAKLTHCPFNDFNLFNPAYAPRWFVQVFLHPLILLSGVIILMFIPGGLLVSMFFRKQFNLLDFLAYSWISNIGLWILGLEAYKLITKKALYRFDFMMVILFITFFLAVFSVIKFKEKIAKPVLAFKFDFRKILLLGTIVFIAILILYRYFDGTTFELDISEERLLSIPLGSLSDKVELAGITQNLKDHFFPYWDLEYADKMGPHILNPPLNYFIFLHMFLLFGNSFLSFTIIFLLLVIISTILSFNVAQIQVPAQNRFYILLMPIYLSLVLFLSSEQSIFFASAWHALGFLHLFLCYYFLILKKYRVAFIFAVLCSLMTYSIIFFVFTGLLIFGYLFKEERKKAWVLLKKYIYFLWLLLGFIVILGFLYGNTLTYFKTLFIEYFTRFDHFGVVENWFPEQRGLWPVFNFRNSLHFIKSSLVSSFFLVIILFLPKRDRISRFFSYIGVIYYLFILFSTYNHEHYVIPLTLLTAFVAPRYFYGLRLRLGERLLRKKWFFPGIL